MIHRWIEWLFLPILTTLRAQLDAVQQDHFTALKAQCSHDTKLIFDRIDETCRRLKPVDYTQALEALDKSLFALKETVRDIDHSEVLAGLSRRQREADGGLLAELVRIEQRIQQIPSYSERLASLQHEVYALRNDIAQTAKNAPALSIGSLMLWDAVSFAVEKYEKDTEQHGVTDRWQEIKTWTRAYLSGNGWEIPDDSTLLTLVKLKEHIDKMRTVGKFN